MKNLIASIRKRLKAAVSFLDVRSLRRRLFGRRTRAIESQLEDKTRELEGLRTFTENFIASVNDMIFVIGSDGRFQFVSGNCLGVMGLRPKELTGKQFTDLVAGGSVAAAVGNFEKIMWGEEVAPYQIDVSDTVGGVRSIEIASRPYYEGSKIIAQVGVARDITAEKKLGRQIAEHNRQIGSLQNLVESLGHSSDIDRILDLSVDRLSAIAGADFSWVYLASGEAGVLSLSRSRGFGSKETWKDSDLAAGPSEGSVALAAGKRAHMTLSMDEMCGAMAGPLKDCGAESVILLPLLAGGGALGVLGMASSQPDYFSGCDIDLLKVACGCVAVAAYASAGDGLQRVKSGVPQMSVVRDGNIGFAI